MAKTALITGASGGIGAEIAKLAAADQYNLVLVARNQEKLAALAKSLTQAHGVECHVIALDLTSSGAAQELFKQTEESNITVDVLVNNAGIGAYGPFHEQDLARYTSMIQLNVTVLTELTHLYLQGMVKRNRGKILNVSSTASFLPGPFLAVYYATKAYVTSFSQAIAQEIIDTKVTVTALCPGPVETDFADVADLKGANAFKSAADAAMVAEKGWQGMLKGQLVTFDQTLLKVVLEWIVPILPRKFVLFASSKAMSKSK